MYSSQHPSLLPALLAICTAVTQLEIGERAASLIVALANIITAALVGIAIQWIKVHVRQSQQLPRQRRQKYKPQHVVLTTPRHHNVKKHLRRNASVIKSKRKSVRN